jgi:hypothetical protein
MNVVSHVNPRVEAVRYVRSSIRFVGASGIVYKRAPLPGKE